MDHNFAIQNHAAERYLMGELKEPERDAYEEHFFCCAACADEIKSASDFMESAKQVVQDELKSQLYGHVAQRSLWGSWLNWRSMLQPIPAAACALLVAVAGFSGYQNSVTIPQLTQTASAQLITPEPFVLHNARAAVPVLSAHKDKSFVLQFDIPPVKYSSYEASVITGSNIKKLSVKNISLQDAKQTLEMLVPAGRLEPGNYALLIEGVDGNTKGELDRIPFELKFQN